MLDLQPVLLFQSGQRSQLDTACNLPAHSEREGEERENKKEEREM